MSGGNITFGCSLSVEDYWDVPGFARRAEEMGFQRVTMGEHIMDGNPPRPTVLNLPAMAAAAGATEYIRIMTGIVIVPLYHPVMLAKMVASVDQVSGGRLDFGIGISGQRGTHVEFDALGISTRTRGRRTDEMLEVMKTPVDRGACLAPRPVLRLRRCDSAAAAGAEAVPADLGVGAERGGDAKGRVARRGVVSRTCSPTGASSGATIWCGSSPPRRAGSWTGFHWGLNQPTSISVDGDRGPGPGGTQRG